MTTDQDLRDLLVSEAAGPARPGAGWDDIVGRGRRHRRVTKVRRGLAVGGLAAVVAVGALALANPDDRDGVVANESEVGTSTTLRSAPAPAETPLTHARAQGVFVTVLLPPADPASGFDPCEDRLLVVGTYLGGAVSLELRPASLRIGRPWAGCESSPSSARGMIELTDPLDGRDLVDARTGDPLTVIDGAPLLFPTELPEPFDIERWDEFPGAPPAWTFSWTAEDLFLNVTTEPSDALACDAEPIEVRGVTGQVCLAEQQAVLEWDEGGYRRQIEIGHDGSGTSPFTLEDVLAITEGLEPLGG